MKNKTKAESRKPISENRNLSFLIENELEKAGVVLAAKSVVDTISKMSEDLATIEGEEIMPMYDSLKLSFGPNVANDFQKKAGEILRNATQSMMQVKDQFGSEVAKLEAMISGTGDIASLETDMDMDMSEPEPEIDMDSDMDMDSDLDDAPSDLPDPFADLGGGAAGRARKESAVPKGKKISETSMESKKRRLREARARHIALLREAHDPDAMLLQAFRRRVREGHSPAKAARGVADAFSVDLADVLAIVRERVLEGYEGIVLTTLKGAGVDTAYWKKGELYVDPSQKDRAETALKANRQIMKMPTIVTENDMKSGISDTLAAKKIAAKLMGMPNLSMPNIKKMVGKYLGMVDKQASDIDFLSAEVYSILQDKGLMEDSVDPVDAATAKKITNDIKNQPNITTADIIKKTQGELKRTGKNEDTLAAVTNAATDQLKDMGKIKEGRQGARRAR
jgi:hypothetical protein